MKRLVVIAVLSALTLAGCKTTESNYRESYEAAVRSRNAAEADLDSVVEPTLPESVWLCDPPSPTVPETPGHHPQPRVCRHSDADHILPGIVRRQAAGGLRADTG